MKDLGRFIGAGCSCIGLGGAGIGAGIIFHGFITAAGKNPRIKDDLFTTSLICFALIEAAGLFALILGLLILYS